MPQRTDWSQSTCSIARGIQAIGDPWTLLILREVLNGTHRFDNIRDKLDIAENILSRRLASMAEGGLLRKAPYQAGGRKRFEYLPTRAAEAALPVLNTLSLWAEEYASEAGALPSIVIICRPCGARSTTGEHCSACGTALTAATTAWIRPAQADGSPKPLVGAQP